MSLLTNNDYYTKLDGNSTDATGNGNNGTDTVITYSAGNGKINQGAGFASASSSKIALPSSALLKPTGNFSVNMWIKTSTTGVAQGLFQSWSNTGGIYSGWQLYVFSSNTVIFQSAKNTGTTQGTDWQFTQGLVNVTNGVFHMVTGVYDGTKLYLYIDGTLDTSIVWANNPAYAATTYQVIGALEDAGTPANFLNGAGDEVSLWSRAITTGEITQLYNSGNGLQYPYGLLGAKLHGTLSMMGLGN